jgi:hypothetical protein
VELQLALAQLHRSRHDDDSARKRLARARTIVGSGDDATQTRAIRHILDNASRLEAELSPKDHRAESLRRATSRSTRRLGRSHPETIDTMIQLAGATSDSAEAVTLLSGAFAASVAGRHANRAGLQRATKAMAALRELEAACEVGDGPSACAEEGTLRASIEKELRANGGVNATEAIRIASEATTAVRNSERPPATGVRVPPTPPPSVDLGPGVSIAFTGGRYEVVVSDTARPVAPPAPAPPPPP